MKKIFTILAAFAATAAMNAATVNWTVDDLGWSKSDNNKELAGETLAINSNLSLDFSNGSGTSPVIYRLTSNDQASYIAFYSNNVMTINATDATITSVTFVVDQDASASQTTQTTAGWKVKVGGVVYSIDSPTWTGSASSVEVVGNSKTALLGLTIEYSVDSPQTPGQETNVQWVASQLTTLNNNDELDGLTFSINNDISFTLADNDSEKDIIFKKTSSAPTTINIYSRGSITFTGAQGVMLKSIQFVVNTSEGTSNTPNWSLQTADKTTTYTADNDTWTGSVNEITFTDKSAVQLKGVNITYTSSTGIENVVTVDFENAPAYDLSGRQVDDNYKGIVIKGGKKIIRR